ncbi:TlpA family protein disulfide reductase [Halovenus rubra]|uniref:TlpA family protein disulfide reductase n=2 Tax=Halovenus rubra TaxID=869890 RepID=A0ABD5X1Z2_9EURY|nr:thioredoxin domain-containing protein [Halovenus rubra]
MVQQRTRRQMLVGVAGSLALAGCVGGDSDGGTDSGETGASDGDATANSDESWQAVALEDVRSGEEFTIADIEQPVVLHTFATWCSTCKRQQDTLANAYENSGDDVTFIDITIDENDNPADLREHANDNEFGWRFAVAPNQMTSDLVDNYGQRVAIAPQSPVIVVCPDGTTKTLDKGVSAGKIEDTATSCQ